MLDRIADLARHDLRERRRRHSRLARLGKCVVEVGTDVPVGTRIGEGVTAAAPLPKEPLACPLASLARVAARPAARKGDCERSRAHDDDEYDVPHGRRV